MLNQSQIIRSLGQALEWFEKEIGWGVSPAELSHLTGRIGELYAAMVTRGQMALETNQRGYDVVSFDGERISVKTVTSSTNVSINAQTFDLVDRVMILRINIDDDDVSIEELDDFMAEEITHFATKTADGKKYTYAVSKNARTKNPKANTRRLTIENLKQLKVVRSAQHGKYRIDQFENQSILIDLEGNIETVTKPILRNIAKQIGVSIYNSSGNPKNTRSLGADIIKALN